MITSDFQENYPSQYINFVTDHLTELSISRKLFKIVFFFKLDFSAMQIISLQVMVTFSPFQCFPLYFIVAPYYFG